MSTEITLITGAGSGIGLELARQFASHGHPLILTSRSESDLRQIGEELTREHGVNIRIVAADLSEPQGVMDLVEVLQKEAVQIDILVNNAGLGQHGKFWEIPLEKSLEMLHVNMTAPVILTNSILPAMVRRGTGRILNTASIAGFMPAPMMAIYHATKAFMLSFSEALATELKDTGVTVTALCPGATDTDFFPDADLTDSFMFQKGNMMKPQDVASAGYDALMRGERVIIPGGINKAMVFSQRFMPEWLTTKMTETFYGDVKPESRTREPGDVANKN